MPRTLAHLAHPGRGDRDRMAPARAPDQPAAALGRGCRARGSARARAPARRAGRRGSACGGSSRVDRVRRVAVASAPSARCRSGRASPAASSTSTTCRTPFDPRVHAEMRSVLLTAVFGFALAVALAVAARRPVPALLLFLAGAGWPATLRGPSGGLVVGGLILLGALSVLAGLTSRNVPRVVIPAAAGLALVALVASTSSAVAKGGLVSWQRWDFYNAAQPPVSVSFVWNAQYAGIHFPRKRTPVLQVKAPRRSLYWRAAVLDKFVGDHWIEAPPLRADALEPRGQKLLRQDVQVLALADTRLVGASVPLRYDAGDAPLVSEVPGIAELPSGLTRGFRYSVWSEALATDGGSARALQADLSRRARRAGHLPRSGTRDHGGSVRSRQDRAARARALCAARTRGGDGRRQRTNAVRRHRGPRVVVPDDRRLPVHRPAAERGADRAARRLRDPDARRLLPALRRCDGADAALSRRAGPCRGRVLERNL